MSSKISKSVALNLPLYKGKDYTGEKIGDWTIIGFSELRYTGKSITYTWLCKCICGKIAPIGITSLLYGRTLSCLTCRNKRLSGKKDSNPNWKGFGEIPGEVLNRIRGNSKRARILEIDIDCAYLDALWKEQDRRCFYTKQPLVLLKTASLDRVDPNKGYIRENVRWIHVDVNRMKWDFSHEKFVNLCGQITSNQLKDINEHA